MNETARPALPPLMQLQAQKQFAVNEALLRRDAPSQLVPMSRGTVQSDHLVAAGAQSTTSTTEPVIPNSVPVCGAIGRVTEAIGGGASLDMGGPGAAGRYGSDIGTGAGHGCAG